MTECKLTHLSSCKKPYKDFINSEIKACAPVDRTHGDVVVQAIYSKFFEA
ncbi:MAG: hypothetical protein ACOX04_01580 [Candidatus Scatomorpha sp.]